MGIRYGALRLRLGAVGRTVEVLATQTLAPGTSGSITISNDGRYGDLTGKVTALEPATGFSFVTQMVPRIH